MDGNYRVDCSCGMMNVEVNFDSLTVVVGKFGACAAYDFLGDLATEAIKNGETFDFAARLKGYECHLDGVSCLQRITECLEDYFTLEQRT